MKIIRSILIGLGSLTLIFSAVIAFLATESSNFKKDNEQFVNEFTRDFSHTWDISTVSQLTTNELLSQISSPKGKQTISFFQSLGEIVEINDMELSDYKSQTGGIAIGVFKFKATFENANTLVTVTVKEHDDSIKIHGFHINALHNMSHTPKVET